MKKHWIIATVALLMIGAVGFVAVVFDIRNQTYRTAIYKARYGKAADLYTQQYLDWNRLPPDDRVNNPWGQGQYGGPEIRHQLAMQQPEKLKADLPDLAHGLQVPDLLADTLYGPHWRQTVSAHKRRLEVRNGIMIASTLSFVAGLIVVVGYTSSVAFKRLTDKYKSIMQARAEKADSDSAHKAQTDDEADSDSTTTHTHSVDGPHASDDDLEDNTSADDTDTDDSTDQRTAKSREKDGYFKSLRNQPPVHKTQKLKDTLKRKAPPLVPKAKQTADDPTLTDSIGRLMSTVPLSQDLTDLTREVSAIREFAAEQQTRVRQLQDGYDWTIIKRFCLRIIRCIDNLDETIRSSADSGEDTQVSEDIRDELTFALESSGVEQFTPEIDSEYKGLEKFVEAVKARVPSEDSQLAGRIAEIVRPGYQYVVNDDDVKVVRCSQVRLYGQALQHCEVTK